MLLGNRLTLKTLFAIDQQCASRADSRSASAIEPIDVWLVSDSRNINGEAWLTCNSKADITVLWTNISKTVEIRICSLNIKIVGLDFMAAIFLSLVEKTNRRRGAAAVRVCFVACGCDQDSWFRSAKLLSASRFSPPIFLTAIRYLVLERNK